MLRGVLKDFSDFCLILDTLYIYMYNYIYKEDKPQPGDMDLN